MEKDAEPAPFQKAKMLWRNFACRRSSGVLGDGWDDVGLAGFHRKCFTEHKAGERNNAREFCAVFKNIAEQQYRFFVCRDE